MSRISESSIATLVWKLVAVANRTVTVTTNNDKTGYSLTAGSYSIRASSVQRGEVTVTGANATATATISSVTTTRAPEQCGGLRSNHTGTVDLALYWADIQLTASTTITITRGQSGGGADASTCSFVVPEYF